MSKVIYENSKRKINKVNFEFKIFSVDNIPTCSSWVGTEDHPREMCEFLSSKRFGTAFHCRFISKNLDIDDKSGLILPDNECPLWKSFKTNLK